VQEGRRPITSCRIDPDALVRSTLPVRKLGESNVGYDKIIAWTSAMFGLFTISPASDAQTHTAAARCITTPITLESRGPKPEVLAVRSNTDRYLLLLPDHGGGSWSVQCGPELPLAAISRHGWTVALDIRPRETPVDPLPYLREIGAAQTDAMTKLGYEVRDLALTAEKRPFLSYVLQKPGATGPAGASTHLWTVLQRADHAMLELHVSASFGDDAQRTRTIKGFRGMIAEGFHLTKAP
jgi:hypothetical protein